MNIIPRSAWTDSPHGWPWRGKLTDAEYLFIHWPGDGAKSYAGLSEAQVAARWRAYRDYHVGTRGWADIGYTHGVDLAGRLWELGGDYVAAHSATEEWPDANERGYGLILLVGSEDDVSPEMADAIRAFREGKELEKVLPHRAVPGAATTCPGPRVLDWLAGADPVPAEAYFVNPAEGRVSSEWGPRRHPITGARGHHRGIDIANKVGTEVRAAYGGTVRAVRTGVRPGDASPNGITGSWNTGNFVLVDGPGGGSEWYGHLHTVVVAPGDVVKAGDRLGTMGQSGNVTGPHLHFETWSGRTGDTNHNPRVDFEKYGVVPGLGVPAALVDPPRPAKPAPKPAASEFDPDVYAVQKVLAPMGYYHGALDGIDGSFFKAGVRAYQAAQLYPQLLVDGVWGPGTQSHYDWTKRFQAALNQWRAVDPKLAVDGDYGRHTDRGCWQVQYRNRRGALLKAARALGYRSAVVDRIPGAVTCRMLGIPTHPLI